MNKPTFILALDAGHYLATPGKRCLKSLDPKETREWILNDRVTRYQQERARLYEGLIAVRVDDPTGRRPPWRSGWLWPTPSMQIFT